MNRLATGRANFWLGLSVGLILGAALLFSIHYVPRKGLSVGKSSMTFSVVFKEAHGLNIGSPVLISGIEAGEVSHVRVRSIEGIGWRVVASIEIFDKERFAPTLSTKSIYALARSSLLGQMTINITPSEAGDPLSEGQLVDGLPPTEFGRIVDDVATITRRLADFVDGRKRGDPNLKRALIDLQNLVRNLRGFSEKLPK